MDSRKKYAKCYVILGVFPDDSWATVRNAYQRQIRRWHPDRFQNLSHQALAEEKTKELNYAYHELSSYHRRFSALPPDGAPNHSARPRPHAKQELFSEEPVSQAVENWGDTPSDYTESVAPRRSRFGGPAVVVTLLALTYLTWGGLWFTASEQEDLRLAAEIGTTKQGNEPSTQFFGHQSDIGKSAVRGGNIGSSSNQGKPRTLSNERSVSGLLTARPILDSIPEGNFGRGSSKIDVLVTQGSPDKQTEHVWYYGTSRVYFRGGKVTGWYVSPASLLNVAQDAVAQPGNGQPSAPDAHLDADNTDVNRRAATRGDSVRALGHRSRQALED